MQDARHTKVLVPSCDHSYREAKISERNVVWNSVTKTWSEYHGEDWLSEGDTVVTKLVAE